MTAGTDRLGLWAGLAGFGLGAIFDGIVLHRLLQWHHVSGHSVRSVDGIRWDGVLDAASVLLLLTGLTGLWHRRQRLVMVSGRCITGLLLIGFGLWHLFDGVVLHLIVQLHRIRPMAEMPLVWDLLWLVIFGILPLSIGLVLRAAPDR